MKSEIDNGYDLCRKVFFSSGTDVSALIRLSNGIESDWLEFKASLRPIDKAEKFEVDEFNWNVVRSIVSLANLWGGAVLIGINDEGVPVGLKNCVESACNFNWDKFARITLDEAIYRKLWTFRRQSNEKIIKNSISGVISNRTVTYSLTHDLRDIVEIHKGFVRDEDVAVILVKAIAFENPELIEIQQTESERVTNCILVRNVGDAAKTRRLTSLREVMKYSKERSANADYFSKLWECFQRERNSNREASGKRTVQEYLESYFINRPDMQSAHQLFVDLLSGSENNINQLAVDYAQFEEEPFGTLKDSDLNEETPTGAGDTLIAKEITKYVEGGSGKFIITGPAGSGKTTLLRYIGYMFASDRNFPIPVYLNLNDNCMSIQKEGIVTRVAKHTGIEYKEVRDLLSKGKMILLLDGYNEIMQEFLQIVYGEIATLINDFPSVKFILASRQSLCIEGFERSIDVRRLRPLSEDQVIRILSKRIQESGKEEGERKAKSIWDKARKISVLKDILLSPFYINIFFDLFSSDCNNDLATEGKIIRAFCRSILNREIAKDKSVNRGSYNLLARDVNDFLSKIAIDLIASGKQVVEYKAVFGQGLRRDIANYVIGATILESVFEKEFKFKHQNLLEYYAAEFLLENMCRIPEVLNGWNSELESLNRGDFFYREEKIRPIVIATDISDNASVFLKDENIRSLNSKWREVLVLGVRSESGAEALSEFCALFGLEKNAWVLNEERNVRKAAVLSLSEIDTERSRNALIRLSKEEEHTTRLFATVALGRSKDHPDVTRRLIELTLDKSPGVASKAIRCVYANKNLSKTTRELIKCLTVAVNEGVQVDAIKREIADRLSGPPKDKNCYLSACEILYAELRSLLVFTEIRDTIVSLITHIGPAVQPPTLKEGPKPIYNGIFSSKPFPGVIHSDSFSGPLPWFGILGGFADGQKVAFTVKRYFDTHTYVFDKKVGVRHENWDN